MSIAALAFDLVFSAKALAASAGEQGVSCPPSLSRQLGDSQQRKFASDLPSSSVFKHHFQREGVFFAIQIHLLFPTCGLKSYKENNNQKRERSARSHWWREPPFTFHEKVDPRQTAGQEV